MIQMKVKRIAADRRRKPLVILMDNDETMVLPILVGINEAMAIYFELTNHKPPRPMTHDLIANMIRELGMTLEDVVINRFHEDTYYAVIHLTAGDKRYEIDARPSDAIAIALRLGAPVYVDSAVLDQHAFHASEVSFGADEQEGREDDTDERFRSIIEEADLDPDT